MPRFTTSKRSLLIAFPLVLLLGAGGLVAFRAQRGLDAAARTAATGHQLAFTLRPLDPPTLAAANPGFEPVAAAPDFRSGVAFENRLYLAGPTGLTVATLDGAPLKTLRSGLELPVAAISALAAGRLRGSTEPQVLIATAGAGVLMLGGSDGAGIRQLLPQTPESRDLTALLPLATGDLLLGTRHHGLLLFDGNALTQVRLPGSGAGSEDITELASAGSAAYLVGTRTAGVFLAQGGTISQADSGSGLPDNEVESLLATPTAAYVGTPLGVAVFDLTRPDLSGAPLRPTRTLAAGSFAHALALAEGNVQVGTFDQGIRQVSLNASRSAAPRLRNVSVGLAPIAPPADAAADVSTERIDAFIPATGRLYALANGNLLQQTRNGWLPAQPDSANDAGHLADRNISALAFDPQGQLYVGFFDHGLDILNPEGTRGTRHFEDDHLFCVNRLVLDPVRQTIAAATANGLVLFDRGGTPRQTLTRADGLISDHVSDVAFTSGGPVLATPAGLTFLTPTGPASIYAFQGLINNHVYTLAAEGNQLAVGTLGGISLLESEQVKRNFTAANSGLRHNWITAMLPTAQGSYLVGTYGAGLASLGPDGSFNPIDLPANTPKDLIINPNALLQTPTHIYAGTLSQGMLVYSRAAGRWQRVTAGLPSLNVTAFAARSGVLYVGTENGLVRIPEARL